MPPWTQPLTLFSAQLPSQVIEREPVKDLKVLLSLETKLPVAGGAAAAGEAAILGFKVSLGAMPPNPPPLSPLTMTREIFSAS